MKKYMIADLIKDISYPETIEFTVLASTGFFDGTFGLIDPYQRYNYETKEWEAGPTETPGMNVKGTHRNNTDLYDVIAISPENVHYPYLIPYKDLLAWSKDTSGSYYNSHIRGQFRPK